ncbi:unnamed protein product [Calicophoron daubneyi]|uniref:Sushi domain-containing protein n=1 Tax=Calicophoron daubneyi TaxID=300641 RepID=A0AAV2T4F7_CALDB
MMFALQTFSLILTVTGLTHGFDYYPPDNICPDSSWIYRPIIGKCYHLEGSSSFPDSKRGGNSVNQDQILAKLETPEETNEFIASMLYFGNMESVWIDGNSSYNLFTYTVIPDSSSDRWTVSWEPTQGNPSDSYPYLLQYSVKPCPEPGNAFNRDTMLLNPYRPYPYNTLTVECKEGLTFSNSTVDAPFEGTIDPDLELLQVRCGFRMGSDELVFYHSTQQLPECVEFKCSNESIPLANTAGAEKTSSRYSYNESVFAQCAPGYVNSKNRSTQTVEVKCGAKGVWSPKTPCAKIECNMSELSEMVPRHGRLSSALTPDGYKKPAKLFNEFPMYGNIISIKCDTNYIFSDRSNSKEVRCTTKQGSDTEPEYQGYGATVLPATWSCVPTTCKYEDVIIKPEYSMQPYFLVLNSTPDYVNLTRHTGQPYSLGATIRFFCLPNYTTVQGFQDYNITCNDPGDWSPQLVGCIESHGRIAKSVTGRFEGTVTESASAKQLGSIMIAVIAVLVVLIFLLDMVTAKRDVKSLSRNWRLQKKRILAARKSKQTNMDNVGVGDFLAELMTADAVPDMKQD